MMRVAHLSRFYHPHLGGTENHIAALTSHLRSADIDSVVIVSDRNSHGAGPIPTERVIRVPVVGPDRLLVPRVVPREALEAIRAADVVHIHDLRFLFELATLTALRSKIPLVLGTHGLIFHTRTARKGKELLWRTYYATWLRRFRQVLCNSSVDLGHCERAGLKNARLVPDAVDLSMLQRAEPHGPGTGALVYFGRLAENKGVERLAPLLDRAPPSWTLDIIGAGEASYVSRLKKRFGTFGHRVRFLGSATDEQLPSLLASHDAVVLPSVYESFGMTLPEALATGVPVVASDIPSYREIARGSPTRLVDFDNPDAAIEAITTVIAQWSADAARARAAQFAWPTRIRDFIDVYHAITA
jgi:glycosyltransferase involved in cell wall biosynthesis